jgi:hypothetical protein
MDRWQYGSLHRAIHASADDVYLFETAGSQRGFRGYWPAVLDELGAEGWIFNPPGLFMKNCPEWLLTSAGLPETDVHHVVYGTYFARRRVA